MTTIFYLSAAVAVASTTMVILQARPVHALLYLIVSLLAVALVLFTLGAPLAAAVEVIIYAGAIMVLFLFVVMMLNVEPGGPLLGRAWLDPAAWWGPAVLAGLLLGQLIYVLYAGPASALRGPAVGPRAVALAMFGPYLLGVELAGLLLLAALVGAYHLGRRAPAAPERPPSRQPREETHG